MKLQAGFVSSVINHVLSAVACPCRIEASCSVSPLFAVRALLLLLLVHLPLLFSLSVCLYSDKSRLHQQLFNHLPSAAVYVTASSLSTPRGGTRISPGRRSVFRTALVSVLHFLMKFRAGFISSSSTTLRAAVCAAPGSLSSLGLVGEVRSKQLLSVGLVLFLFLSFACPLCFST